METDLGAQAEFLEPDGVRVKLDDQGRLCLRLGEETHVDIKVARAFPLSGRAPFVSLLTSEGKEIGVLRGLEGLDPLSRKTLEGELERAYFMPEITRVLDINERYGVSRWVCETDRGARTFEVRDKEDVRILGGGKIVVLDADGNRYFISDPHRLDRASQMLVETQL